MSIQRGRFIWYELLTNDMAAAEAFYAPLMGWTGQDSPAAAIPYRVMETSLRPAAGIMTLPASAIEAGSGPFWMGYIAVEDVDATAASMAGEGATIHHPPTDIPTIGRFAAMGDPQGAVFCLFRPDFDTAPSEPGMPPPGHGAWNELHTPDPSTAFAFYARHFGWTAGETLDMGPIGPYQIIHAGDRPIGGIMTLTAGQPRPSWLFYVHIPDIEAALAQVRQTGGEVLNGPHPVPGGALVAQCRDPQGAVFALVQLPAMTG